MLVRLVVILGILCGHSTFAENNSSLQYLESAREFQFNNPDSSAYYLSKASQAYNGNRKDSIYAQIIMQKGIQVYIQGNTDMALMYYEEAKALFSSIKHNRGYAESLLNIGEAYYNWAQFELAIQYFKETIEFANRHNLNTHKVRALNYIGKYHHSKGNFTKSLQYYKKGLQLAEEIHDSIGIVSLNNKIGKHHKTIGNYAKSLECFLRSESLVIYLNNKIELASTYNHLGNIYQEFKDFEKAIFFHSKALIERKEMGYQEGIAKSLKNLGEVYFDINKLDSALICYNESYIICKEIGYAKGLFKNIFSEGLVYQKQGKVDDANGKFQEGLALCRKIGYAIGETNVLIALAKLYEEQGQLGISKQYANQGLKISLKENIKESSSDLYAILSDIAVKKGDNKKALDYFKEHTKIKNEILNLETNQKIAELRSDFEVSLESRENDVLKKENEIQELQIKRKNQLIIFAIILTVLLVALIGIVYGRLLHKKKANKKLSDLNNNIIAQNKELDELNRKLQKSKQQQIKLFSIISHELRNPLYWFRNLIQMLTAQIDNLDKAMITKSLNSLNESATNTFHLMDNLLHWSRSQLGNLQFLPEPVDLNKIISENISLIRQYASIKKITVDYCDSQEIWVNADKVMVKTVVRNLLSNAVKFTPQHGMVNVDCDMNSETVTVKISDNGLGMDLKTVEKISNVQGIDYIPSTDQETGSGIGLILTKEFLEINNSKLTVQTKQGEGSVFMFELPVCAN